MASKIQEQIDYMVKNGIPLPMEIKIAIDQNSKRILQLKKVMPTMYQTVIKTPNDGDIPLKDLEYLVKRINEVTKSPPIPCSKNDNGKVTTWIGNYHLDYAYNGVKLVRMVNEAGDISTISAGGYGGKQELYNWMQAFLAGHAAK